MAVTADTTHQNDYFCRLLPPLGVFMKVGFKGHFWLTSADAVRDFITRHHSTRFT